ncbi:BCCT family transporter [Glutamicibacter sp. PS]|uniref:BCCT family transporter n=1 Tax=Glutamicibacter TaxID=1742989 RepID=UPI00283F98C9|nr:BCCT family transporter [Glutamicibacter sp. PS]MDR4533128.1 BCCT family transporter [Glutamicibacter sp. PS]
MAENNEPQEQATARSRPPMRKLLKEFTQPGLVHPALIPGIGVESTRQDFRTNKLVFALSGALILAVILWAVFAPDSVSSVGGIALSWVTTNFGWMFGLLSVAIAVFMLIVGYSRTGGIRLGADEEKPEFSTVSWVAMLFSAGIGIGLLFYGPYEPLVYFQNPPYGFESTAGTPDAMHDAMAQTMLHWGPIAWAYYALVGGAIAYSAYRRGRPPLISSIFEPIFGRRTHGPIGATIDIFAILVTLFGTAISLGIGALQIGRGYEVVTGAGPVGNAFLIGAITLLTVMFILSAVSGVKRGIRALSNLNMVLAGLLALFIFLVGPTLYLLNFMPAGMAAFFGDLFTMLMRNPNQSPEAAEFMGGWTTYYWAWWVTWTPFVGLFIAKISRGRTLREFVTVVIIVPALVCFFWFSIFGGTSMWMEMTGQSISDAGSPQAMLFALLDNLPGSTVLSIIALVSIVVFFITSADSASIVMASMSQRGRPEPSRWVTVVWGLLLGLTAASLLLAGGEEGLSGLQSLMVVSALPFAFVVMGIIVAWWRDLRTDPYILRAKFAHAAIAQGIRRGIEDYGDDFVFNATAVDKEEGAGAGLHTEDPQLTEWYLQATGEIDLVKPGDITRTLQPGKIQHEHEQNPEHTASGDASLTVGEK